MSPRSCGWAPGYARQREASVAAFHRELVDGFTGVPITRSEHSAGKLRFVGRIRKALRLKAETGVGCVKGAPLAHVARHLALKRVARKELQAWFGRPHLHRAP